MRSARLVSLGISLCLFISIAAFADSIDAVNPAQLEATTAEVTMSISGSGLTGNVSTVVNFEGPVQTSVEVFDASPNFIELSVPPGVSMTPGTYAITIDATDDTGVRHVTGGSLVVTQPNVVGVPLLFYPESVIAEASSARGGIAFFDVSAMSAGGAPLTPTCDHDSGTNFPLGTTHVNCSVSDAFGTTTGSFNVFVTDTVAPVLTLPTLVTSDSAVVTWTATAVDNIDGSIPVTCSPESGSTFSNGETSVRCSAEDSHANSAVGTFSVFVNVLPPPFLTVPNDIVAEATAPNGTTVTFAATTDPDATVACSPASGSNFPLGITQVDCTATRGSLTTTGSFFVNVVDTRPPTLTVPSSITTGNQIVTFTATATDVVDVSPVVTCFPGSGSFFPIGTTTVICVARDFSGNATLKTFDVNV